jgi:2-polyprenyl-3-methyl-5-hydroxy-6-metoxy-1,4-benzoquinol methylase
MLRVLLEHGADASGIEPYGTMYLRGQGHTTFARLDELPRHPLLDGILAVDVLEHVLEPWTLLKAFNDRLDQGGWLYLSTPNPGGLRARFCRARWSDAQKPGHLYLFYFSTLTNLLKSCGFQRVVRLTSSIRYHDGRLRRLANLAMQSMRVDGVLRCMAWKQ